MSPSQLLREMPLILVALVIFTQSTFPSTYLILGLCSNCIALGFKLRSVPMTVDDFVAYIDMRDLYAVLKSPSSMMQTAKSIDVGAIPRLEADEAAPGAAAPETAEASYYSLHDRTARPGTVTQVLAGLGGLELAPDTLDRGEGGMLETVLETDEEANDGGTPDDPSDSFVYPPSGHEVRSEFGTLNADKESEGTELARTPSADKTVGGTLGRGERVE